MKDKIREKLLEEKIQRILRKAIYNIIDEETERFHIHKDYVWLKLFSSSDYKVVIKIVKDKKPIENEKFLEAISYRLYRELGIKNTFYDTTINKGKYQKLHY